MTKVTDNRKHFYCVRKMAVLKAVNLIIQDSNKKLGKQHMYTAAIRIT